MRRLSGPAGFPEFQNCDYDRFLALTTKEVRAWVLSRNPTKNSVRVFKSGFVQSPKRQSTIAIGQIQNKILLVSFTSGVSKDARIGHPSMDDRGTQRNERPFAITLTGMLF